MFAILTPTQPPATTPLDSNERQALLPPPTPTQQPPFDPENPTTGPVGLQDTLYNPNNNYFGPDLFDWSDLASWGQFEGLVTAGNGMYDAGMLMGEEGDFQFDFNPAP